MLRMGIGRQCAPIEGIAIAENRGIQIGDRLLDVHLELAATDMQRTGDMVGIVLFLVPDIQRNRARGQQSVDLFRQHFRYRERAASASFWNFSV